MVCEPAIQLEEAHLEGLEFTPLRGTIHEGAITFTIYPTNE